MNLHSKFPERRKSDRYAWQQLRERRRELELLEFEYGSKRMSMSEYRSCRRSLLGRL